jgi:hypothetical protein
MEFVQHMAATGDKALDQPNEDGTFASVSDSAK